MTPALVSPELRTQQAFCCLLFSIRCLPAFWCLLFLNAHCCCCRRCCCCAWTPPPRLLRATPFTSTWRTSCSPGSTSLRWHAVRRTGALWCTKTSNSSRQTTQAAHCTQVGRLLLLLVPHDPFTLPLSLPPHECVRDRFGTVVYNFEQLKTDYTSGALHPGGQAVL